ncbi:MAG: ADP-ribosylglycohydrolase family protein, partial [Melioribacteraceae bacterium]
MEKCFDIGNTVSKALNVFRRTGEVFAGSSDAYNAGNGSIMRLAPIPMFFYPNLEAIERYAVESSRTTHGAVECLDACRLFSRIIYRALSGYSKEEILFADKNIFTGSEKIVDIARGNYKDKVSSEIRGTGYVVDSLEAALWCFCKTDNFKEAILMAANLGDDADTTSAVCGQLAGAYYGISGIPENWLDKLFMRKEITEIANKLYAKTLSVS